MVFEKSHVNNVHEFVNEECILLNIILRLCELLIFSFVAIRKACKAMHMVEANHELATALFSKKHKEKFNEEERASAEAEHRKRKLARMEAVRQAEGSEPQLPIRVMYL